MIVNIEVFFLHDKLPKRIFKGLSSMYKIMRFGLFFNTLVQLYLNGED